MNYKNLPIYIIIYLLLVISMSSSAQIKHPTNNKAITNCAIDTLTYPFSKRVFSSNSYMGIGISTSINAVGQYFNAPDTVKVHGFDFYSFKSNSNGGVAVSVTAAIYNASVDSLPMGPPLHSQQFLVDTTSIRGSIYNIKRSVNFTNTITVTNPYIIVITNTSTQMVVIAGNNMFQSAGRGEGLSSVKYNGSWVKGLDLYIAGSNMDGDYYFHPHVSYNLNADFTLNPDSLYSVPSNVIFTNSSNDIINDRMYNQFVNNGNNIKNHTYDFDNSLSRIKTKDGAIRYQTLRNYNITLYDSLLQYNGSICASSTSKTLAVGLSTGVDNSKLEIGEFDIYPNPASNLITVKKDNIKAVIYIVDLQGKLVRTIDEKVHNVRIDISNLKKSVYYVRVGNKIQKLLIQ